MAFLAGAGEAAAGEAAAGGELGEVGIGETGSEAFSTHPQDIGGGNSIQLSAEQIHSLLHSADAVAAIMERGKLIQDAANEMAITGKGTKNPAHYGLTLQNRPDTTRSRVNIWTENYRAVIDDHYHGTLLKAAARFPSDERIPYTPPEQQAEQPTSDAQNVVAEGGEEGGSAAELAEAAEIAAI